eukprot:COSAG02_NODE_823_length_16754_cov_69.933353_5_plen_164_part_00
MCVRQSETQQTADWLRCAACCSGSAACRVPRMNSPLNRAYRARLGMARNWILARNLSQRNSGTDCAQIKISEKSTPPNVRNTHSSVTRSRTVNRIETGRLVHASPRIHVVAVPNQEPPTPKPTKLPSCWLTVGLISGRGRRRRCGCSLAALAVATRWSCWRPR